MSDDESRELWFELENAHASATHPRVCSELQEGDYIVIRGRPCEIVQISATKKKIHVVGLDVLVGKKMEDKYTPYLQVDVPTVSTTKYQLVGIEHGYLNLMTDDGTPKNDLRVPDGDLGKQIQDDYKADRDVVVTVVSAMGEERATGISYG